MSAPTGTRLWRDRQFRSFWAGHTISQVGDRISELAIPLIAVTELDASAGEVAVLTALVWAPNLLAIAIGAWVDVQPQKRLLMVVADLVRAAMLMSLPVAYWFGSVTITQLYLVSLSTGAAGVLFNTAYPSLFASLVPRSSFLDANSKLSASRSASYVAGPALGGVLVGVLGAPVTIIADVLSFLASAVLVGRVRLDERSASKTAAEPLLRRARQGLSLVLHDPVLRASLGCATTVNFFTFVGGSGLYVLFASRELGLSSAVIGMALGVGALGSLLGAVVAPRVSRLLGIGRTIAVGAVLFPAPLAIAATASGPHWSRALIIVMAEFLTGLGVMLLDVNLNSLQTSVIPDGMRSRVGGAFSTVNYGVRPAGALVGGLLATLIGLRATLVVAAAGGVLSVLWLLASPVIAIRAITCDGLQ